MIVLVRWAPAGRGRLVAWLLVRRLLIITAMVTLVGAASAAAADADTAATTLTPTKVSSPSALSISITGLSGSGLPSSVALLLQPGFTSSIRSVPVLCTASQSSSSSCPAASQIGTGSVGVSFLTSPLTVALKLYLGSPLQAGDIASVVLSGSLYGINLTISGRLFVPAHGGLELLLSSFPSEPVTLDSLSISAQASQTVSKTVTKTVTRTVTRGKGKHKHKHKIKKKVKKTTRTVYSVITDPSKCTGMWTGTATLTYTSSSDTLPLTAACTTS